LNFLFKIQAFSRISQARYEPWFIYSVNGERSKTAKSEKGNINCNNIDIQVMLLWLILPFDDDFAVFQSVAINSVYKRQFFTFMISAH